MKFLITGANGFVGKALCAELLNRGHAVRAAVRAAGSPTGNTEVAVIGSIDGETDWSAALAGVEVVIIWLHAFTSCMTMQLIRWKHFAA